MQSAWTASGLIDLTLTRDHDRRQIDAALRHAKVVREMLDIVSGMAADRDFNVYMDFEPDDMQFITSCHVPHGRTSYAYRVATSGTREL